jgi:alpha-L-fucosidase
MESFTIEAKQEDGEWHKIGGATTIGYKRIVAVPDTSTTQIRVRFDEYRSAPTIAEIELYY